MYVSNSNFNLKKETHACNGVVTRCRPENHAKQNLLLLYCHHLDHVLLRVASADIGIEPLSQSRYFQKRIFLVKISLRLDLSPSKNKYPSRIIGLTGT